LQPEDLDVNYEDNYIEQKIAKKAAEYAANKSLTVVHSAC
jgi:hypothetical protein